MTRVPEIMVTIGPTLEKPEDLRQAVEAGARWFRLPCGYRQRPHLYNAQCVRQIAAETGIALQLLLDLPSSRPRTGKMPDLNLELGDRVKFWDSEQAEAAGGGAGVCVPLPGLNALLDKIEPGQRIWFCDGRLEFVAEEVGREAVVARLERGVIPLKASNSIYLPDSTSPFTMMTDQDRQLLAAFAAANLVPDWVALSLVGSAEDVIQGRDELAGLFAGQVRVMAKIETAAAVDAVESILQVADALMVARGDLGPAVEFIRLPEAQEDLVAAGARAGKIVVVATQILEYFAEVGVPQRSELSGLSLLALQAPDVVMLGKETVYSPRPIECIRFARNVLSYESCRLAEARRRLPRSLAARGGRPHVVAIEGPNGAGKTHLCGLLGRRLGVPCRLGVPAGWQDSALKLRMIRDADWLAAAMYFLSGVIEASREAADCGAELQVTDRSLWSTLAVHFAHDPVRLERLLPMLDSVADRLQVPDLTIVLEASPATCARRIARKTADERELDMAGGADEAFHRRERDFYHWLAAQGPKVAFLNTDDCQPEDVCRRAADLIRESFPC
ncbi:MAG: pyruvate kinase [Thermoguttaceae bacterium]